MYQCFTRRSNLIFSRNFISVKTGRWTIDRNFHGNVNPTRSYLHSNPENERNIVIAVLSRRKVLVITWWDRLKLASHLEKNFLPFSPAISDFASRIRVSTVAALPPDEPSKYLFTVSLKQYLARCKRDVFKKKKKKNETGMKGNENEREEKKRI